MEHIMYYNIIAINHLMYVYVCFWILWPPLVKQEIKAGCREGKRRQALQVDENVRREYSRKDKKQTEE